jgi:hypothetical protein
VQLWLGHHSAAFTLDTYVHLLPDDLPDADVLEGATEGQPDTPKPAEMSSVPG